jgi:hypothetical protein
MFSMVTVASSTRMPTASARPPSVITLMVSPSTDSVVIEARMASGMEIVMINVDRQLPRNSRIISPVRAAAMAPSRITPDTASLTNTDWSPTAWSDRLFGSDSLIFGNSFLTPLITSRVEAEPDFWIVINTA